MSFVTTTYWCALSIIVKILYELIVKILYELIVKILYEFNGFKHHTVNMLLSRTHVDKWKQLQTLPFNHYKYPIHIR